MPDVIAVGRIAWSIAIRGFRSAGQGIGLYLVSFTGCAAAATVTGAHVGAIAENGLLVGATPLVLPLNIAITIGALYAAFAAAVSVSKERESGTMEVLFFGPVDAVSYVAGRYLEQLLCFALVLFLNLVTFLVLGQITNFSIFHTILPVIILSIPLVSSVTTFGILLSTLTSRTRTSLILLIVLLVVFLGVQWAETFLGGLDPRFLPPALQYGKALLAAGAGVVRIVLPFAHLDWGLQVLALWDLRGYIIVLAVSVAYSAVLLALTMMIFRWKGARSK